MRHWLRGRGLLGRFQPLVGRWQSASVGEGAASAAACTREFTAFGEFVRLEASWDFGGRGTYRELALFGKGEGGTLAFWSFTNDGKRSTGTLSDGGDVHPDAIAFVAEMPAGTARTIYWPDDSDGFDFAVESRTAKGWNRMVHHRYAPG
jgi:hypothetical protein